MTGSLNNTANSLGSGNWVTKNVRKADLYGDKAKLPVNKAFLGGFVTIVWVVAFFAYGIYSFVELKLLPPTFTLVEKRTPSFSNYTLNSTNFRIAVLDPVSGTDELSAVQVYFGKWSNQGGKSSSSASQTVNFIPSGTTPYYVLQNSVTVIGTRSEQADLNKFALQINSVDCLSDYEIHIQFPRSYYLDTNTGNVTVDTSWYDFLFNLDPSIESNYVLEIGGRSYNTTSSSIIPGHSAKIYVEPELDFLYGKLNKGTCTANSWALLNVNFVMDEIQQNVIIVFDNTLEVVSHLGGLWSGISGPLALIFSTYYWMIGCCSKKKKVNPGENNAVEKIVPLSQDSPSVMRAEEP